MRLPAEHDQENLEPRTPNQDQKFDFVVPSTPSTTGNFARFVYDNGSKMLKSLKIAKKVQNVTNAK